MTSRKGFRDRLKVRRRGRGASSESDETQRRAIEMVRAEAHGRAEGEGRRRRRRERPATLGARFRRAGAQLDELWLWMKGWALENRRRLRVLWRKLSPRLAPVTARVRRAGAAAGRGAAAAVRPVEAAGRTVLAPVAPYVSAGLFAVLRGVAAVPRALLDAFLWAYGKLVAALTAAWRWAEREVTPARTFAVVGGAAAIALGVSQFVDYRGIAVGADQYAGEVGTVADVPRVEVKTAGEAHAYVLVPLALAALVLVWLTLRGRPRLGWALAAIGGIGLVVTLAIDMPKGLDAGTLGDAYAGTEAQLLAGFWAQLIASAALAVSGIALSRTVRPRGEAAAGDRRGAAARPGGGSGKRRARSARPFGSGAGA